MFVQSFIHSMFSFVNSVSHACSFFISVMNKLNNSCCHSLIWSFIHSPVVFKSVAHDCWVWGHWILVLSGFTRCSFNPFTRPPIHPFLTHSFVPSPFCPSLQLAGGDHHRGFRGDGGVVADQGLGLLPWLGFSLFSVSRRHRPEQQSSPADRSVLFLSWTVITSPTPRWQWWWASSSSSRPPTDSPGNTVRH